MLKLTYTEAGLYLERITASVENLVSQRTILAVRTGKSIYVKPNGASFLIPANAVNLQAFKQAVQGETSQTIDLCQVDDEFYEVSLRGTWIASSNEAHTGIFVACMHDRTECFIETLWKATQNLVSLI
ncbi:hypothetical protein IQ266_07305 [filamentous cyanobacterium LEGE 11480]|uniref:Uncharacterized protein n=1 Tax=Romeriopsis navalis LEGE 11480 TaxID=2777977 RepID=A0A928Z301_9CYAN|nr:alr0857 family protein [Romeriopsis navalis]MBE9029567.1 hypothetical protein [Romeriopsis navalis LEGE 11480]